MSLSGVQLEMVDSVEKAEAFLRWLGERRPVLAVDTETTGLEWWTPRFVRLIQFGDGMTGWSVSVRDWRGVAVEALRRYEGRIVMHNASFDMHAIASEGLPIPQWSRVDDTYVMHHLIAPEQYHGLKRLGDLLVDPNASVGQLMLKKGMQKNQWTWATVPEDFMPYGVYGAMDTVLTARLWEQFEPQIHPRFDAAYEREMVVREVLHNAETRGIRIDVKYTTQLLETYREEMERLRLELEKLNITSPNSGKQVAAALRDEGWEPDVFTPGGEAKTSEDVLAGLDYELVPKVIRYKRLRKWSKAYLETFLNTRDADDRVHPSINPLQAKTGRMSITGIPLQTLPRGPEIRNCIIPSEGMQIACIDYSNIELRLAGSMSGDPFLHSAFLEGVDMHSALAAEVFGPEFTPKQRGLAKNGRYANLYGAGVEKLAKTLGVDEGVAQRLVDAIKQQSPALVQYGKYAEQVAGHRMQQGDKPFVNTWGGRIAVADPDKLYTLLNYLIQGTAADLFKSAIVSLYKQGFESNIIVPVHDELVLDIPTGDVNMVNVIKETMEFPNEFSIPIECHASELGDSWGACS